jgi:hypothetical protein
METRVLECYNIFLGPVAQLVEQRIENPRVGSSILPQATKQESLSVCTEAFLFVRCLTYWQHFQPTPH